MFSVQALNKGIYYPTGKGRFFIADYFRHFFIFKLNLYVLKLTLNQIDLWLIFSTFQVSKYTSLHLDSVLRGVYCAFFIPFSGQGALENVAKLTIQNDKRN